MIREPIPSPEPLDVTPEYVEAVFSRFWNLEPVLSLDEAGALIGCTGSALRFRIYRGVIDLHIISRGDQSGIRRSDMLAFLRDEQSRLSDAANSLVNAA